MRHVGGGRGWRAAAGALAVAAFSSLALVATYVRTETFVHTWDHGVFHELAVRTRAAFAESPLAGIGYVVGRARDDYTAYFAVPLVPALAVFGESRLAFVASIALLFHLPLTLALGRLGAHLVDAPPRAAAWSTTAIALLVPIGWVPLLRGYPDSLSALLTALAAAAYLEEPALRRRWQYAAIPIAAVSAIVIRRHFVTTIPLMLIAMGVTTLFVSWRESRAADRAARRAALLRASGRVGLLASASVVALLVIGRSFLARYVAHDYYAMYSGYLTPVAALVRYYAAQYGALAIALAALGFLLAAWRRRLRLVPAVFLGLFGALVATSWLTFVRQVGEQYTLHLLPFVVLGLAALGWTLFLEIPSAARWAVPVLGAAALGAGLFFGLSPGIYAGAAFPGRGLMPANWAPLEREDMEALRTLVALLRDSGPPPVPVLVVASSPTLNPDLVRRAEMAFFGWHDTHLQVLPMAEVDTRDAYPVSALGAARLVVTAEPLQQHLGPDQQRMLAVVHELFERGEAMAADFDRLDLRLALRQGVQLEVYRRRQPSEVDRALATLRRLEEAVPRPSPLQLEWVVASAPGPTWVERWPNGATLLTLPAAARHDRAQTVAVYRPTVGGAVRLSGGLTFLGQTCPAAELVVVDIGPEEAWRDVVSVVRRRGENGTWQAAVDVAPAHRLGLRLTVPEGQPAQGCLMDVEVSVQTASGR